MTITGKEAPDKSAITWKLTGALPPGLSFDGATGVLSGTPSELADAATFTVSATYRRQTVSRSFSLGVLPAQGLIATAGYRTWEDGSFAESCNAYLHPGPGFKYSGSTGDGLYRIQPPGQSPTTVYCDMAGGGYTLLGKAVSDSYVTAWGATSAALNVPASPSPTVTFKYSEAFINAVPKTVYRIQSVQGYQTTRFWDGRCAYATFQAASAYCWTSFANEGLTIGRRNGEYSSGAGGLHDIYGNTGFLIVSQSNTYHGWGGGSGTHYTQTGTGAAGTRITLVLWAK